jgi:HSP20 family protein
MVRWEEEPFRLLRREMGTLLDRMFGVEPMPWGLEVEELEKEVVIRAEAPGFEAPDFDIHLMGEVLTIRAEHKAEKGKEGGPEDERRCATVRRSVTLPPGIDVEKVAAAYRNGVLEVHLPRKPEALGRRIEVKT